MFDGFDAADLGMRRIVCRLLVPWGEKGIIGRLYDPVAVWRDWADALEGRAIENGHYLAEENPAATLAALEPFLAGGNEARFASRTRCPAFRHRDKGP